MISKNAEDSSSVLPGESVGSANSTDDSSEESPFNLDQKKINDESYKCDMGSGQKSAKVSPMKNGNSVGKDLNFLKTAIDDQDGRNRRKMSTESCVFSYSIVPPVLILSNSVNSIQDLGVTFEEKKNLRQALPEIFAAFSATCFHIIVGVSFACTSALMSQLEAEDSDIKVTKSELAWIVSIVFIVLPITSIFAGVFMETFGRLNAVRLAVIPAIISCVITALATDIYTIVCGRLFFGIATALGTNPAIVYVTEITSAEYRGALISSGPTLSSLGMMIGYIMGAFLPWRTASWINIIYCLIPVFITIFFFIPESPIWLVSKNRIEQARLSLTWLYKSEPENKKVKIVERKLRDLIRDKDQKMAAARGKLSFWRKMAALKKPTGYKPFLIMVAMFCFQQYTGVYITTFYIVQYFEEAGSKMNPFHASILVGLARFVMSVVTACLLKTFGRRPLCFASCIGMAIFAAISGYFTHQVKITGESSMIPVFTITLYVAFSMIGLLSLPWTMAAEVFPAEIRGIAHGLVMAIAHGVMFVSLQTYYQMADFLGGHDGLQWFFSVMCIVAFLFIYFFLPETHDRSLFDIESYFQNRTIYSRRYSKECKSLREEIARKRRWSLGTERRTSLKPLSVLEALTENQAEYDTLRVESDKRNYSDVRDLEKLNERTIEV